MIVGPASSTTMAMTGTARRMRRQGTVPPVPALLARIAIAVVALLVVAWSAVLWRDDRIGSEASNRLLVSKQLSDAEWAREVERLRDAELLDPAPGGRWPGHRHTCCATARATPRA